MQDSLTSSLNLRPPLGKSHPGLVEVLMLGLQQAEQCGIAWDPLLSAGQLAETDMYQLDSLS